MVNWSRSSGAAACLVAVASVLAASASWAATPDSYAHVPSESALAVLPSTAFTFVIRDGYTTPGDSPPLMYTSSSSACSLNSGNGDGGSQVPSADGRCWLATFGPGGLRAEWFGATAGPIILYVNSGGSDQSGANVCISSAHPCATWQHAVNEAQLFDVEGGNIIVHDTDTSPHNFAESISATNPLRGAANGAAVPQIGSVWPSQIILDGNNEATITGGGYCYGVAASNNAIVGVENITISPTAYSCQDGLFAQLGGGINFFGGVTLGATGSNGYKVHAENTAYGVEFWQNYSISGNGAGFASAGPSGVILISAGTGTISGSPSFGSAFVYLASSSVFQTDIANPWGSTPGTISGNAFLADSGGSINSQGNSIAWPGNPGILRNGGQYRAMPANSVLATTGLGTGGSAAFATDSTAYSGEIVLTAGSAALANGYVKFSTPFVVQTASGAQGHCVLGESSDGSAGWNSGAGLSATAMEISPSSGQYAYWANNGLSLSNGSTYAISYSAD